MAYVFPVGPPGQHPERAPELCVVEWFQGVRTMSKSKQKGIKRDLEVLVMPSRRKIGDPEKQRILAEYGHERATGGKVNESLDLKGGSTLKCRSEVGSFLLKERHQIAGLRVLILPKMSIILQSFPGKTPILEGFGRQKAVIASQSNGAS